MLPAWDDRFLASNQASFCRNTYLYSGSMVGWRKPRLLRPLDNPLAKFAFRLPITNESAAAAYLAVLFPPQDGDTVTLGEITYTLRGTVTQPYDVLLGNTALRSAQALFLAMTQGAMDPAVSGVGSVQNSAIAAFSPLLGYPFQLVDGNATPGAQTLMLMQVTPSGTGKLADIDTLPVVTAPGARFTGVIYNAVSQVNIGGTVYSYLPGTVIAQGHEVVGCVSGVPIVSTLPVPVTLVGGETYFIGFMMDSAIALQLASTSTESSKLTAIYASGPPNPVVDAGVTQVNPITSGGPTYMVWGNMNVISDDDQANALLSHDFGGGAVPVLAMEAPDTGQAYNNTGVAESTSRVRMSWLQDLVLTDQTNTFVGGANAVAATTIDTPTQWLEFLDRDTNVLRTPVTGDSFKRYYFSSPSVQPQYNTTSRIQEGKPPFLLGIPAPGCAPALSVTGGGNAATLGNATSDSTNQFDSLTDTLWLMPVFSQGQQAVQDIQFQSVASDTPTPDEAFVGVIYADLNGAPGALLAIGQPNTGTVITPGPLLSQFATPYQMLADTPYWIGICFSVMGQTIACQLADDTGAGTLVTGVGQSADVPVLSPVVTPANVNIQMWADVLNNAALESRAYVYTWVSEYGEEGPPSPPTVNDGWSNGVWTVEFFTPPPSDMGALRNIQMVNIYRTVSGVQGNTTYFFVDSVDIGMTKYVDAITDDIVAEQLILPSISWFPPPEGLLGMASMPNGIFVGFKANEIWFSEPYRPHAWPPEYVLTCDFPVVGIGVSGQSVVACTNNFPVICTGVRPGSMSQVKVPRSEPCLSRGGIVSTDKGVYFASTNGLILVNPSANTAENRTEGWVTREKWSLYVPDGEVRAQQLISSYHCFSVMDQTGFTVELSEVSDKESFGIYPQPGGHRLGFGTLFSPNGYNVDNMLTDPWTSIVMLIQNGGVYIYDFEDTAPTYQTYLWRSKKIQLPHKDNFAAFRVWFDIPPGGPTSPAAPRAVGIPTYSAQVGLPFVPGMFGVVRVLADGKYVTERELRHSAELMRVTSGYKATTWQFEVEGVVSVSNIKAATSVKELAGDD